MAEYIERESAMLLPELPKEYRNYQTDNLDDAYEQGWYDALCCLEHIPAADVAPVVHGWWKKVRKSRSTWECSVCGTKVGAFFAGCSQYCYCCGAQMGGITE